MKTTMLRITFINSKTKLEVAACIREYMKFKKLTTKIKQERAFSPVVPYCCPTRGTITSEIKSNMMLIAVVIASTIVIPPSTVANNPYNTIITVTNPINRETPVFSVQYWALLFTSVPYGKASVMSINLLGIVAPSTPMIIITKTSVNGSIIGVNGRNANSAIFKATTAAKIDSDMALPNSIVKIGVVSVLPFSTAHIHFIIMSAHSFA